MGTNSKIKELIFKKNNVINLISNIIMFGGTFSEDRLE